MRHCSVATFRTCARSYRMPVSSLSLHFVKFVMILDSSGACLAPQPAVKMLPSIFQPDTDNTACWLAAAVLMDRRLGNRVHTPWSRDGCTWMVIPRITRSGFLDHVEVMDAGRCWRLLLLAHIMCVRGMPLTAGSKV
jgi:hypothetical protein